MRLSELLAESNLNLLRYLQQKQLPGGYDHNEYFDDIWRMFVDQYLSPANRQRLERYLDRSLANTSFADYYALPPKAQRFFADFFEQHGFDRQMVHDDPHDAPAWMTLSPTQNRLLPATTWLVHFTDHADQVVQQGFRKGVEDLDQLHLTRLGDMFGNVTRRTSDHPGYNFAYLAADTNLDARIGGYGRDAVMFQARGVPVWHDGDRENQVIFYGPNVAKSRIVLLRQVPGTSGAWWRAEWRGRGLARRRSLNRLVQVVAASMTR